MLLLRVCWRKKEPGDSSTACGSRCIAAGVGCGLNEKKAKVEWLEMISNNKRHRLGVGRSAERHRVAGDVQTLVLEVVGHGPVDAGPLSHAHSVGHAHSVADADAGAARTAGVVVVARRSLRVVVLLAPAVSLSAKFVQKKKTNVFIIRARHHQDGACQQKTAKKTTTKNERHRNPTKRIEEEITHTNQTRLN